MRFDFDTCPVYSPFGFKHLTHQHLSARALFYLNSLAKVNTQMSIYNTLKDIHYVPKNEIKKKKKKKKNFKGDIQDGRQNTIFLLFGI